MNFGRYITGHSWLHQLDPRSKMISCAILTFLLFHTPSPVFLVCLVLSLLLLPFFVKMPWFVVGHLQKRLVPLLLIVFMANLLLTPGSVLEIQNHTISGATYEGLNRGITLALRLNAVILIFSWLTLCTSPSDLTDTLAHVLRPLNKWGISTHPIVLALSVALRFVPIVFQESERIYLAQVSRGASFSGLNRITGFVSMLIPLFGATISQAERLTHTLESRGYQLNQTRSQYKAYCFHRRDWIALITLCSLATFLIFFL